MTTPINLGSYLVNQPTPAEQSILRNSLGIKTAALLNANFSNSDTLTIVDPNNTRNTITINKALLGQGVAERLLNPRVFSISGDVTSITSPVFDGTTPVNIVVSIDDGVITAGKIASGAITGDKIGAGVITPNKLSQYAPTWADGITTLQRSVGLGVAGTDGESSLNMFSSTSGTSARLVRAAGTNGQLTLSNTGTGNIIIRGLTAQSDGTLTSTRQLVGSLEITGNKIGGTSGSGLALNQTAVGGSTSNFLDTTIYDGKGALLSSFNGATKIFETSGIIRAIRNGQVSADTAAIQARSTSGNVAVLLNANGATGASLVHIRNSAGLQVKNSDLQTDAPLRAGSITGTSLTIEDDGSISTTGTVTAGAVTADTIASDQFSGPLDGSARTVDNAAITAEKLSGAQTGVAPVFGARAWVSFNGTTGTTVGSEFQCTINDSGNVSKVVRTSTGIFVIHFTIPMNNINYLAVASGDSTPNHKIAGIESKTSSTVTIGYSQINTSTARINPVNGGVVVFG
jgi:hypothetical protein